MTYYVKQAGTARLKPALTAAHTHTLTQKNINIQKVNT